MFQANWLFSSGEEAKKKKKKKKIKNGCHGDHLGFLIRTILAIFDVQVTPMLPTMIQVNWPFSSGEEKNRFSRWQPWQPSWISDQNNFSFFDQQVTPMLPTEFQVNRPFGSRGEANNRYSRWWPWRPSWISDWNNFNSF